jgi:hypothetical protein
MKLKKLNAVLALLSYELTRKMENDVAHFPVIQ